MSYINLVAYIEHKINNIFHHIQYWVKVYIKNIIYRAKSLFDLLNKLQILFNIFFKYNISIKPIKFYLNYLNIGLFGKKLNFLRLITLDKKFKVICFFNYSYILGIFKYYLGLISYLRGYIHFYAQLTILF